MIGLGLWLMLLRSRRHQPDDNGTDAYAKMVQKMAEIPGLAKGVSNAATVGICVGLFL